MAQSPTAALAGEPTLSDTSLSFPNTPVGKTSDPLTSELTNTGGTDLGVGTISDNSSQFATTDNCPSTLGPGEKCTISVTFKPTTRGPHSGTVTVSTDGGSPQISLSGKGTSPGAAVSPSSLAFGSVAIGTTSQAKTVKLTNTGNVALSISSIAVGKPFAQTNKCGSSLAAGASCSISVTFHPTEVGATGRALSITDAVGTQKVSVSGYGTLPSLSFSPSSVTFEKQRKGTTSPTMSVVVTNVGKVTVHVSSVSASGDFDQTNSCAGALAVKEACTISVSFHPTAEGTRSGTLSVRHDYGSESASLTGLGVFPAFSISTEKLKFGKTGTGLVSRAKVIKVTNPGSDRLFIQSLKLTGDFTQTNTCEPYINPTITCTISVSFKPTKLKKRTGVLTLVHDLGKATVKMTGVGIPGPPPTAPTTPMPLPSSQAGPPIETASGSHFMRYLLAGGLAVLVIGLALMFLARGRSAGGRGEPEPTDEDLEGAAVLADTDLLEELDLFGAGAAPPVPAEDGRVNGNGPVGEAIRLEPGDGQRQRPRGNGEAGHHVEREGASRRGAEAD